MVRSMTGFAVREGAEGAFRWRWEARSVNGRGLDLRLRLPEGAEALEPELRRRAGAVLRRGSVTVGLRVERAETGGFRLDPAALAAALTDQAAAAHAAQTEGAAARLREKVRALLDAGAEVPPERLAAELALLAVRNDVSEEIDRLRAHVAAARRMLAQDAPVGRELDFLTQEFNREANTLCSKAASAALTEAGLALKVRIDRLREQVQNIE